MYELPRKLLNNLRLIILGNKEILGKSKNECRQFSAQPTTEK